MKLKDLKKPHSLTSVLHRILTLSLLLAATSGSGKAENTAQVAAEDNIHSASQAKSSDSKSSEVKQTATKLPEPAPLAEDVKAMVLANRNATVQEQFAKIADSQLSDTQKVQSFLLILPSLNRDGQRTFARGAVQYVNDSTHVLIQRPLLEGKLDKQILSIFMTDTLKRPNRVKLPALLELARTENNPMRSEARDLLVAFSGKNHGTNWVEWQKTVTAYLASNPG